MKALLIATLLVALLVGAAPAAAKTCDLWGQKVKVLKRSPSGKVGYDAVMVRGKAGVFFVLAKRGRRACD